MKERKSPHGMNTSLATIQFNIVFNAKKHFYCKSQSPKTFKWQYATKKRSQTTNEGYSKKMTTKFTCVSIKK